MPVEAEFIAHRIYLAAWIGIVTTAEVRLSQEQVLALREVHHDTMSYVLILEVNRLIQVQLDFQLVRNVLIRANNLLLAQVIVGASHSARITALTFGAAFRLKYRFADNRAEAIPFAEAYLLGKP